MRTVLVLASIFLLLASGCSDTEQLGTASFCFAAESDVPDEQPMFELQVQRRGLQLVPEGEQTTPPEHFEECAAGMAVKAELVDEDGEHVWLAVLGRYGARDLIPREIFQVLDGADLQASQSRGWVATDSLRLSNGQRPIVALQSWRRPDQLDLGSLAVEVAGPTALPSFAPCGSMTATALRFLHDDGEATVANGESAGLVVGAREYLGHNIFSVELGEPSCTDGPGQGVHTTWVLVDASI